MAHEFREPVKVVILLSALALVEVFILIVSILVVLVAGQRVDRLLGQVVVEVASYQFNDNLLYSALAGDIEGHALEIDSLPQMVQLARVEDDRRRWHLVTLHCKVEDL